MNNKVVNYIIINQQQVKRFLLACSFLVFYLSSYSQNPLHKQLNKANGFFSNTIYDIYQDKIGFIWFATEDGLIRFDGLKYKEYPIKGNKSSAISNILETSDGRIWVQNFSGQFFYTKNDSLYFKPEISVYKNFMVATVLNGKTIAVFTKKGIRLYDTKKNKSKDIELKVSGLRSAVYSNSTSYSLYSPTNNTYYELTENGVIKKNKSSKNLFSTLFYTTLNHRKVLASKINDTIVFESGFQVLKNKVSSSIIQNIAHLSENELAILTTSGFLILNQKLKESKLYFSNYSCSKAIRDNEGNMWLGTINEGVIFIPHLNNSNYLENQSVTAVFANKKTNTCLIGTKNNEIFEYNLKNHQIHLRLKNNVNHEIKTLFQNPYSNEIIYCSEFVYHLNSDLSVKNQLLVSANHISLLDKNHYLLSESNTLSIYPVNKNDYWLKWKSKNRILNGNRLSLTTENRRFYKAFLSQQNIIAHSADGLWEINQKSERKLLYKGKNIEAICIEKSPIGIFILTSENGVLLYQNGKIIPVISKNKFQNKKLSRLKTNDHQLFILSNIGTDVFDFKGKKLYDIVKMDGFPGVDIIEFDIIGSTVLTGNVNGFVPIQFSKSIINTKAPKLVLNQLKVNQLKENYHSGMLLKTAQNSLHFSFSILDYQSENSSLLYYSINNKKWVALQDHDLNLNELQYGKYDLKVKAMNMRGKFSQILNLNFEIQTPYYKKLWFILTVFLLSLFLVLFIVWIRFREIREKNKILQEKMIVEKKLYQSTLASIKAQMNPHFIFNALNTIQSFIYTNDRKTASSYLVSFSELTRMILDMSNREFVQLSEEITALSLYLKLEKMRFEENFTYEIDTEELPHLNFQIPSMLIQPYVENAIKHGLLHKKDNRNLKIHFKLDDTCLEVSILDNGIGIEASQKINKQREKKHESFATEANQKRFEILNQLSEKSIGVEIKTLKSEDGEVKGTLVELKIPIK